MFHPLATPDGLDDAGWFEGENQRLCPTRERQPECPSQSNAPAMYHSHAPKHASLCNKAKMTSSSWPHWISLTSSRDSRPGDASVRQPIGHDTPCLRLSYIANLHPLLVLPRPVPSQQEILLRFSPLGPSPSPSGIHRPQYEAPIQLSIPKSGVSGRDGLVPWPVRS